MNSKIPLKEIALGVKNSCFGRVHKRNISWRYTKPRRLLWADGLAEVIGEDSNKWASQINSISESSDKKIKSILKKPCSSKQVALGM